MNKFSNKFFKYMLGIMLFIGLFFWCDDVFAAEIETWICKCDNMIINLDYYPEYSKTGDGKQIWNNWSYSGFQCLSSGLTVDRLGNAYTGIWNRDHKIYLQNVGSGCDLSLDPNDKYSKTFTCTKKEKTEEEKKKEKTTEYVWCIYNVTTTSQDVEKADFTLKQYVLDENVANGYDNNSYLKIKLDKTNEKVIYDNASDVMADGTKLWSGFNDIWTGTTCKSKLYIAHQGGDKIIPEDEDNIYDPDDENPNSQELPSDDYTKGIYGLGEDSNDISCEGLLGNDLIEIIKKIYSYIKLAVPVLLIIFGSIDFSGAVLTQDKDTLAKAFNKFIKRAIIAAAIFLLPALLSFILSNAKVGGQPLVDDPMCGIQK